MAYGLRQQWPDRPDADLDAAIEAEMRYSTLFQQNMVTRLRRDLPLAYADPSPEQRAERIEKLLNRERGYLRQHEEMRWNRAAREIERSVLRELSPAGAYWHLSPLVKEHTLDCVAPWALADGPEALASSARPYSGKLVRVMLASGQELPVTPNHPVLTPRGWVGAGELQVGDQVFRSAPVDGDGVATNDHQHGRTFREVHEALNDAPTSLESHGAVGSLDFHGDGTDGEVSVVTTKLWLDAVGHTQFVKDHRESPLVIGDPAGASFTALGASDKLFVGSGDSAPCALCGGVRFTPSSAFLGRHKRNGQGHGTLLPPDADARFEQARLERLAGDPDFVGQTLEGLPGLVSLDEVIKIVEQDYTGHVHNLSTTGGWYTANGVIVRNCLALGQSFWPWSVLDKIHPPMHGGCACRLFGVDDAVSAGWMTRAQLPDPKDAELRALRIAERFDLLREADVTVAELNLYLEESRRHAQRWNAGTTKGGQFRPLRGGVPGLRSAARRALRGLHGPDDLDRRVVRLRGRVVAVPHAERWERTIDGHAFVSPAGGTNIYRDGTLASEPNRPPVHPDVDGTAPLNPANLPSEMAQMLGERRATLARRMSLAMQGGAAPVEVGDGPEVGSGLTGAGFRMTRATPDADGSGTVLSWWHPASGAKLLTSHDDERRVTKVTWTPEGAVRATSDDDLLDDGWEKFAERALAWGDRIAEVHDDHAENRRIAVDPSFPDTSGQRDWDGTISIGSQAERTLKMLEGRGRLSDEDSRQVYRTLQTTNHELLHGINPIDPWDFGGGAVNANLEEALTEEISHVLTQERLFEAGRSDVLAWALDHPTNHYAAGTYQPQRTALRGLLDEFGIAPEDRRDLLFEMKFRQPTTDERVRLLASRANVDDEAAQARIREALSGASIAANPHDAAFVPILAADVGFSPPTVEFLDGSGRRVAEGGRVRLADGDEGKILDVSQGRDAVEVRVLSDSGALRMPELADVTVIEDAPATPFEPGDSVRWGENVGRVVGATPDYLRVKLADQAVVVGYDVERAKPAPSVPAPSNPANPSLDDWLREFAALRPKQEGWKYSSIEELVRAEGTVFTESRALSADEAEWQGAPRQCYANAANAVLGFGGVEKNPDWTYVEGFVRSDPVPFPIQHAWVQDKNGTAIELTLDEPGQEYVGIAFSDEQLRDSLLRRQVYGVLDDYDQGFRLLRKGLPTPPQSPSGGRKPVRSHSRAGQPPQNPGEGWKPSPQLPMDYAAIPNYDNVDLQLGKSAGGSNGALWAFDKDDRRWLVKTYRGNQDRVATELLANRTYAALGIRVANAGTRQMPLPQSSVKAAPQVEELDSATPTWWQAAIPGLSKPKPLPPKKPQTPEEKKPKIVTALTYPTLDGETRKIGKPNEALGAGFMADALVANWDVVGLSDDNVLWQGEKDDWTKPVRIDQGGTFELRAQGQKKPYGPVPTEVWTMRAPNGQAFGTMALNAEDMKRQARHIGRTLTDEKVDELIGAVPFSDEEMRERVRGNLKARVQWMRDYADGKVDIPQPLTGVDAREEMMASHSEIVTSPEEDRVLRWAGEGGISAMNGHLRDKTKTKDDASPEVQDAVVVLDELFGDVPPLSEDLLVYAPLPVPPEKLGNLPGLTLTDRGFMPLTTNQEDALWDETPVLELTIYAGTKALHPQGLDGLADVPGADVLLRRGVRYKVVEVETRDGRVYVKAVVLK